MADDNQTPKPSEIIYSEEIQPSEIFSCLDKALLTYRRNNPDKVKAMLRLKEFIRNQNPFVVAFHKADSVELAFNVQKAQHDGEQPVSFQRLKPKTPTKEEIMADSISLDWLFLGYLEQSHTAVSSFRTPDQQKAFVQKASKEQRLSIHHGLYASTPTSYTPDPNTP